MPNNGCHCYPSALSWLVRMALLLVYTNMFIQACTIELHLTNSLQWVLLCTKKCRSRILPGQQWWVYYASKTRIILLAVQPGMGRGTLKVGQKSCHTNLCGIWIEDGGNNGLPLWVATLAVLLVILLRFSHFMQLRIDMLLWVFIMIISVCHLCTEELTREIKHCKDNIEVWM